MPQTRKANKPETEPAAPAITEAEWTILKVVWKKHPCPAGDVQEALAKIKGWAYSTVKTTMDRMVQKGLLNTHSIRSLQLFTPAITEAQAQRNEIFKTIKRAFDGALTPMMQFLLENEKFSEDDLKQLRNTVDKAQKAKSKE